MLRAIIVAWMASPCRLKGAGIRDTFVFVADIRSMRRVGTNLMSCEITKNNTKISLMSLRRYLSLDFMNQKGHLIKKSGPSLERHEVPVEQGEPLALELASFLSCVQDATTPKTDGSFGKSALEVALTITRQIQSAWES